MKRIQTAVLLAGIIVSMLRAQPGDTLIFSHSAHIGDIGASCADCHAGVVKEGGRAVTEASCKVCHDNTTASFECSVCHSAPSKPLRWHSAASEIRFSHVRHESRKATCVTCHAGIEKVAKGASMPRPAMKICLTCHDNRTASATCATCHSNIASIKPADHDAGWLEEDGHGFQARFSDAGCRSCHAPSQCEQCHQGQTSYRVHTPGYQFMHGQAAKRHDLDCAFCHAGATTCIRCHTGLNK